MGTDIHGVWQARVDGKWVGVPGNWEQDRHYLLFAVLGNVRNGFGAAGIPTHVNLPFIGERRGVPDDFSLIGESHPIASVDELRRIDPLERHYFDADMAPEIWMGDHSYSWVTADEVLSHPFPKYIRYGVVTLQQFKVWDGKTPPGEHCSWIGGPGIEIAEPSDITEKTTHVSISWEQDSAEDLAYFINETKRLKDLHGDVRLVFGFDS